MRYISDFYTLRLTHACFEIVLFWLGFMSWHWFKTIPRLVTITYNFCDKFGIIFKRQQIIFIFRIINFYLCIIAIICKLLKIVSDKMWEVQKNLWNEKLSELMKLNCSNANSALISFTRFLAVMNTLSIHSRFD